MFGVAAILGCAVGAVLGSVIMVLILHPMRVRRSETIDVEKRQVEEEKAAIELQRAGYLADVAALSEAKEKLVSASELIESRDAESRRRSEEIATEQMLLLEEKLKLRDQYATLWAEVAGFEETKERVVAAEAMFSAREEDLKRNREELEAMRSLMHEERLLLEQSHDAYAADVAKLEEAKQQFAFATDSLRARDAELQRRERGVEDETEKCRAKEAAFEARVMKYADLQKENAVIKLDLRNLLTTVRKQKLDQEAVRAEQRLVRERSDEVAELYLGVMEKAVSKAITANNFVACRDRLAKAIERVREIGFVVTAEREAALMDQLRQDFEMEVREALRKEEQARAKELLREEERIRREAEREKIEKEREAAKARKAAQFAEEEKRRAMEEAKRVAEQQAMLREMLRLAEEKGAKELEVATMRKQIGELEVLREQACAQADDAETRSVAAESAAVGAMADAMKAVSNAQLTKAGHVYVISNIGSFGKGVFKIGATRRSDPDDRIRELGDASVPFPFDVHMMIKCDDAPGLENALHRGLAKARMNRVNPRKEFFRADLEVIVEIAKSHHGCEVDFVMDAEAAEWKQSQEMLEGDAEYIESVFEKEGTVAEVE